MPPSPIRKLVPYAEAARKRGVKIYQLNIGQPDIETPPAILKAIRDSDFKILAYSHSAGNISYRKALVKYYATVGIAISHEDILITTGGSEAILFGFMSCLDAGDEVIVPEPFYANYNGFAVAADVVVKPILSNIETGFALPPMEEFEKIITSKTKAVIICNPNNPTGYLYSKKELETLKDIAIRHNLYLFSDEAYREFCYSAPHVSCMQLEGLEEYVVLMDTISKRYSACGARIGAFITKNKQVLNTALKFAQARLSPPTFGQIAGEAALHLPSDYFSEIKSEYLSRRDLLVRRLNAMPGVFCPEPRGAFYAMASLPIDDADNFCQWLLESFEHQGATVMLAPGTGFYFTKDSGKNEVRLAYVLNQEALDASMDCLEEALKVYSARTSHH